jgi:hypothetical protein
MFKPFELSIGALRDSERRIIRVGGRAAVSKDALLRTIGLKASPRIAAVAVA